ncbi:luciferase family protein [Roseibium sp. SCPC15]|jgi:phospholipase/carboxylesterase|uniref:luciferase domain-containing protein n=1 Tax=Roseibium sp. SCP15 TaxID=3141376 RepID=UPI003335CF6D
MKNWLFSGSLVFALLLIVGGSLKTTHAEDFLLPQRDGVVPRTTGKVPHIQIGAKPVPKLSNRLLRKVSTLPGVDIRATVISLPGAKGFWLDETLNLAHPEAIVGGREFAHLHPDGSLHASLPPKRAREAVKAGWAVMHPWANSRPGWEGFVLIFTPRSIEETDIVFQLVLDGYNYVTGQTFVAPDR